MEPCAGNPEIDWRILNHKVYDEVVPKARHTVTTSLYTLVDAIKKRIIYVDKIRQKYGYSPLNELDDDINVDRVQDVFKNWILAGGSLVSLSLGEEVNDYDLFFPNEQLPIIIKYLFAATYAFDFGLLETKHVEDVDLDAIYKSFTDILVQVDETKDGDVVKNILKLPPTIDLISSVFAGFPDRRFPVQALFGCLESIERMNRTNKNPNVHKDMFSHIYKISTRRLPKYNETVLVIRKKDRVHDTSTVGTLRCTETIAPLIREDIDVVPYTSFMYLRDIGFMMLTENSLTLNIDDNTIQIIYGFSPRTKSENNGKKFWEMNINLSEAARNLTDRFDFMHTKLWATNGRSIYNTKLIKVLCKKKLVLSEDIELTSALAIYRRMQKFLNRGWTIENDESERIVNLLLSDISNHSDKLKIQDIGDAVKTIKSHLDNHDDES